MDGCAKVYNSLGSLPQQLHAPQADLEGAEALSIWQAHGRWWKRRRLSQVIHKSLGDFREDFPSNAPSVDQ